MPERAPSAGGVFLSYASEDGLPARCLAESLRSVGIPVWCDVEGGLEHGDEWDRKIRLQIRDCLLFVPMVSAHTEARAEGYFRLEWDLAAERARSIAAGVPFLLPVVLDETREAEAMVPDRFRSVQWTRLPGGALPPEILARFRHVWEQRTRFSEAGAAGGIRTVPAGPPAPAPRRLSRVGLGAGLAAALALGVWWNAHRLAPPAVAGAAEGIAVLPFANQSADKDQEYLADGITEEILNALAREPSLRVPGRASCFWFKGRNLPAQEIARTLGVPRFIEGSVRRSGDTVRISVSLTRASDGFSEPLGTFDRKVTDVFALEDAVAKAVVARVSPHAKAGRAVMPTQNPQAYDLYLRGRALQVRSADGSIKAAELYEKAVALDPRFALAWARLAEGRFREYAAGANYSPGALNAVKQAIDRALEAQPDLPEALIVRANWFHRTQWDVESARRDLTLAESLQPPTAELRISQFSIALTEGDLTAAPRSAREVLRLDPQNGDDLNALALGYYEAFGDYVEADRLFARAIGIQGPSNPTPGDNRLGLRSRWRGPEAALRLFHRDQATTGYAFNSVARVMLDGGHLDEAKAELSEVAGGFPKGVLDDNMKHEVSFELMARLGYRDLARGWAEDALSRERARVAAGDRAPQVMSGLIETLLFLGRREEASDELDKCRLEAQGVPAGYRRWMEFGYWATADYAQLSRVDEALDLLRERLSAGAHFGMNLRYDSSFDGLRKDPRFQQMVDREEAWARSLPDPADL